MSAVTLMRGVHERKLTHLGAHVFLGARWAEACMHHTSESVSAARIG